MSFARKKQNARTDAFRKKITTKLFRREREELDGIILQIMRSENPMGKDSGREMDAR